MNFEYLQKVKAELVAAFVRSDDSMDKIIRQIAADQREACVEAMKNELVLPRNVHCFEDIRIPVMAEFPITTGKKLIAAVRTAEINEK